MNVRFRTKVAIQPSEAKYASPPETSLQAEEFLKRSLDLETKKSK